VKGVSLKCALRRERRGSVLACVGTRGKMFFLEDDMLSKRSFLPVFLVIMTICFLVVSCGKKGTVGGNENGDGQSSAVSEDTAGVTPGGANFGNYPADYPLAFATMAGFSKPLTVRTLFGPNAYFSTFFEDIPVIVTLESTNGTQERFTAQLLVTMKVPEKGDMKFMRMQITFEPDSMSEMSYVRYIKIVNMINGEASERRSNGTQNSDVNIMGFFIGTMEMFWDVSKYR
jgi:hypothetical protein